MARQSLLSVLLDLNADGFEKGLHKAQRSMRRTANQMKRSGAKLTRNVTAPLAIIGASSFKAASEFEASMAKVKAVSGATAAEFKNLRDNALELGRSTRFSASEVSALQLEFSKLGFTASEITKVTGATLALAQATGSDLAQSAEVAGATLRAFGLDASETQRVTDVMAASFSSSALDMDSFQDSMKFVAPVARKAGLSIEETTAMLAQLANNGIKGSAAGTALRRILSTVGATGGDVKKQLATLSKEVVTLGDAKDEVGRTAQSAFLVLKDGLPDVANLTKAFQQSTGAAGDMAAIMDDTADGALKRMQSAVEGAQITIGNALAPVIIDVVKQVERFAQGFSELSKGTQGFLVKLGLAAAAIGPFKSSLGALLGAIAKSDTATKLLAASMKVLNTTMRANPFAIVATGIGLVVGGLILLNSETEEAASATDKLADATKGLSLEEQKRSVEEAIENQRKLVDLLKTEKDAKQAIVDSGFGGKARNELNESTAALQAANTELAKMEELLAKVSTAQAAVKPPEVSPDGADVPEVIVPVKLAVPDFLELKKIPDLVLPPIKKTLQVTKFTVADMVDDIMTDFDRLKQGIQDSIESAAVAVVDGFARMLGAGIATGEGMQGVGTLLLGVFADLALNLGGLAIGYGIAIESIKEALKSLNGPVAIAAGVGLIALGAGLKAAINKTAQSSGIPALKEGGLTTGPTLALIGDNPSGKEAVIPFEKMGRFLEMAGANAPQQAQHITVTGRISGGDILLTNERALDQRTRVRNF